MKIGIVCYPTFGGSGIVATELGKALAREGHEIHFISYKEPARLDPFLENIHFHEVSVPNYPLFEYPPYETALTSKMVEVIKLNKLDILHVHYAIPHASAAYMAKQILNQQRIFIPIITTLHGTDITLVGRDSIFSPIVTFSINNSERVTAVSEHLKEETIKYFNPNREIEIIPNFVDISRFKKKDKNSHKKAIAQLDEKVLIHTSNFRRIKRVNDVVKIFHKVHNKIPSILLLVGDGPERQNIERLCKNLGISNKIRFLGKLDPVEEMLEIADLFLMPSQSESFGLAALEAMACHIPVISSDIGGIPEININGVTGFLSEVGNVDEMAENALRLLKDDNLLTIFKKNAFQQAIKFDINIIVPKYLALYDDVLLNSRKVFQST